MGQCDEFACYMTQDVAQRWLLYTLSSLLHHVNRSFTFMSYFPVLYWFQMQQVSFFEDLLMLRVSF